MIKEVLVEDGTRVKHYSDRNMMIRLIETGILYEEAVDYTPCKYTYEETNEPIVHPDEVIDDSEAMRLLFGGDSNGNVE